MPHLLNKKAKFKVETSMSILDGIERGGWCTIKQGKKILSGFYTISGGKGSGWKIDQDDFGLEDNDAERVLENAFDNCIGDKKTMSWNEISKGVSIQP